MLIFQFLPGMSRGVQRVPGKGGAAPQVDPGQKRLEGELGKAGLEEASAEASIGQAKANAALAAIQGEVARRTMEPLILKAYAEARNLTAQAAIAELDIARAQNENLVQKGIVGPLLQGAILSFKGLYPLKLEGNQYRVQEAQFMKDGQPELALAAAEKAAVAEEIYNRAFLQQTLPFYTMTGVGSDMMSGAARDLLGENAGNFYGVKGPVKMPRRIIVEDK